MTGQDGEIPAIAQGGITNLASRVPVELPFPGAAAGSSISIRGFRFAKRATDTLVVRIRRDKTYIEITPLSVQDHEIVAIVPEDAPPGSASLQVVKNGRASQELPIQVVESSFGAFSRHREARVVARSRMGTVQRTRRTTCETWRSSHPHANRFRSAIAIAPAAGSTGGGPVRKRSTGFQPDPR